MFSVISCLGATHDWRFVLGAVIVCLIGAFSTVIMLARAQECARKHSGLWTAAAAVTGGTSIWATHFIAMLAYDGGYPIVYDGAITALSILVSIVMSWGAFTAAFRWPTSVGAVCAGCMFGVGIAAMHFTGMLAIMTQGHLSYSPGSIVSALAACVLLGSLALLVIRLSTGHQRVILGTLLVTATVCALHFISMSGVTLIPEPLTASQGLFPIDHSALAAIVAAVSSAVVLLGGSAALMDRHLTDVRGLADAAMEGLLILQDGKIIEVNQSFLKLFGGTALELQGIGIEDILLQQAPASADYENAGVFGTLLKADGSRAEVEVLSRELEYRGRQSQALAVRDLTERLQSERVIDHLARHDPLTGLANRREFDLRMEQFVRDRAQGSEELALLFLDLDNFKAVNDGRGHAAGDAVLRTVAEVLKSAAGTKDFVARLGGDEFAVVQVGQAQPAGAERLARELMRGIAELKNSDAQLVSFGASIGVAVAGQLRISAETLQGHADAALYEAKKAGKSAVRFFDAALEARLRLKQQSEAELAQAFLQHEFAIDYRPFRSASGGIILGYRANIYWQHPLRGTLSASSFLPSAKECGLLNRIVCWMFERAAVEAQAWPTALRLAVPLLDCHLLSPGCYEEVSRIIRCTGLDPRRLDLVVPEAALGSPNTSSASILKSFEGMGVGLIVTDLLSQQSAMATLHRFGPDRVKVDAASLAVFENRISPHVHRAALNFLQATGVGTIATDAKFKAPVKTGAAYNAQNELAPAPDHASTMGTQAPRARRQALN